MIQDLEYLSPGIFVYVELSTYLLSLHHWELIQHSFLKGCSTKDSNIDNGIFRSQNYGPSQIDATFNPKVKTQELAATGAAASGCGGGGAAASALALGLRPGFSKLFMG
jgi:hypothetical protein